MARKSQKQKSLDCLVKAHIDATADRVRVKQSLDKLVAPKCPLSVSSLSELQKYSKLKKNFDTEKATLEDRRTDIDRQVVALERDIIGLIPVKCVWVKVDDYAVSYYYDVWGGGHYDLEIKRWSDNLPEQKDKLYYA